MENLVFLEGQGGLGILIIGFVLACGIIKIFLDSYISGSVNHALNKKLEEYKFENERKMLAVQAAEYLFLAVTLTESDSKELYQKVNKMGWELALLLPAEIYRKIVLAIASKDYSAVKECYQSLLEVRKLILKDQAGDLSVDDIALHLPGIGREIHVQSNSEI